jgi:hypothetical protein
MVNLLALLDKKPVFEGAFEDAIDVFSQFDEDEYERYVILYANYDTPSYEGYAHVLGYDKVEGKFFEVYGSHCSCYGLEGQWEPEYHTDEEMAAMIEGEKLHNDFLTWINN